MSRRRIFYRDKRKEARVRAGLVGAGDTAERFRVLLGIIAWSDVHSFSLGAWLQNIGFPTASLAVLSIHNMISSTI